MWRRRQRPAIPTHVWLHDAMKVNNVARDLAARWSLQGSLSRRLYLIRVRRSQWRTPSPRLGSVGVVTARMIVHGAGAIRFNAPR